MMIRNRKCGGMMICGLALMLLLGSCGNVYAASGLGVLQNGRREHAGESERPERKDRGESKKPEKEKPVGFGSVPYFRDDSCSNTQLSDGWIYGYWSRQLCRVNADTLESEVLFETDSPQDGFFSIYNNMIYFLEQRGVSSPEGKKANLWRMNNDGSRQELIAENFAMSDRYMEGMEIRAIA